MWFVGGVPDGEGYPDLNLILQFCFWSELSCCKWQFLLLSLAVWSAISFPIIPVWAWVDWRSVWNGWSIHAGICKLESGGLLVVWQWWRVSWFRLYSPILFWMWFSWCDWQFLPSLFRQLTYCFLSSNACVLQSTERQNKMAEPSILMLSVSIFSVWSGFLDTRAFQVDRKSERRFLSLACFPFLRLSVALWSAWTLLLGLPALTRCWHRG